MSIRPEKLKQYISLKDTAAAAKNFARVITSDPQSGGTHATVALEMPLPAVLGGKAKSVYATLCSFSDSVYMASNAAVLRVTFAVENMQKGE